MPCVPLELRLTPTLGRACSRSPTEVGAAAAMSSVVRVVSGPTELASRRWMRDPVTTTSESWASGAAPAAGC